MIIRKRSGKPASAEAASHRDPWKIFIVDDEPDIHSVTEVVLRNATFDGRPLRFLHAHSGKEAIPLLRAHSDIAVILLDVVMDGDRDGLDLCRFIREDLGNDRVRIILRTGQPGAAPERSVIESYDIDDYREKSELPSGKLYTCVRMALKGYRDLLRLDDLYQQTLSLQRATGRVMNHLSHELRTPLSIVRAVLGALCDEDAADARRELLERGERNMARLIDLHEEIRQIFREGAGFAREMDGLRAFRLFLQRAAAEIRRDPTAALELLEGKAAELDDLVRGPVAESPPAAFDLGIAVAEWVEAGQRCHNGRTIRTETQLANRQMVFAPSEVVRQSFEALWRNAVENTPDEGLVMVRVAPSTAGKVILEVADRGVGITEADRAHVFSGFFHTQSNDLYSSRQPFAFDAGGKGLSLLKLKLWAQRLGWRLELSSQRCRFLVEEKVACPGRVSACSHCTGPADCESSGGSGFQLILPAPGIS